MQVKYSYGSCFSSVGCRWLHDKCDQVIPQEQETRVTSEEGLLYTVYKRLCKEGLQELNEDIMQD